MHHHTEDILLADQPAVKQGESRCRHHQHQRSGREHPGDIGGLKDGGGQIRCRFVSPDRGRDRKQHNGSPHARLPTRHDDRLLHGIRRTTAPIVSPRWDGRKRTSDVAHRVTAARPRKSHAASPRRRGHPGGRGYIRPRSDSGEPCRILPLTPTIVRVRAPAADTLRLMISGM